ncbi:MAG TPA: tRNA (adenosine(37)-N6)-threonylcarbamoyltransferase complex ATPase subunit type 1 TsaE [Trebonia sp.]
MSEVSLSIATAAQMRALGRSMAAVLRAGDLVILSGGLGAGKTTLTQGIGDGLGVRGPITSPTFVIARVHPPVTSPATALTDQSRPPLVHADAYRLGSALELDDLDLDTDTASSVTVVEWGEGLAEGLSVDRLEIAITPVAAKAGPISGNEAVEPDDPTEDVPRTVRISAVGERWEGVKLPFAGVADRL